MTDLGLTVEVYQPFRDFEGMPEPFRSRNFDRAERKFDLMEELGTDLLMICSNHMPWVALDVRPMTSMNLASTQRTAACGLPMRRWAGAVT